MEYTNMAHTDIFKYIWLQIKISQKHVGRNLPFGAKPWQ